MPDSMPENMSKKDRSKKVICSESFLKSTSKSQNDALWGPACIIAIINKGTDMNQAFDLGFFCFIFFCALAVVTHFAPIHFYKQATLRTETFTESSFYAQTFLHTEVCAHLFFVHRRLYTQRFSRKEGRIYTQMLCTNVFARINKGTICIFTQNLFHREAFAQNSVYTFTYVFSTRTYVWHRETCTHRLHTEVFTDRVFCMQKLYPEQFLHSRFFFAQKPLRTKTIIHSSFYRLTVFTHRKYQKVLRTEVLGTDFFTQNIFYIQKFLHTDVFTQTQIAHRKLCTQHAFTHSQLLHREALFPLLDHLPFVFPLSSEIYSAIRNLRRILSPCLSILGKWFLPLSAVSQISWCHLWSWV